MDLGQEALGSYKALQGGCTQIQVRRLDVRVRQSLMDELLVPQRAQRLSVCAASVCLLRGGSESQSTQLLLLLGAPDAD